MAVKFLTNIISRCEKLHLGPLIFGSNYLAAASVLMQVRPSRVTPVARYAKWTQIRISEATHERIKARLPVPVNGTVTICTQLESKPCDSATVLTRDQ